jgi:ribosome biogenesis GTPase A
VTRTEQRLVLADDFYLYDTPGMLWPRIIVPQSGFHLAASGAVGRNAYDDQEVALELLDNLKLAYPGLLIARYGFGLTPDALADVPAEELLETIGRQRGALVSGGRVDAQKAAELVIGDFRATLMGRITLETPQQYLEWLRAGRAADALRRQERQAERPRGPRRR